MVNPTQAEVDRFIYSLDPDYEEQRRQVREFWDLYRDHRRAVESARRAAFLARMKGRIAGILGAIIFCGALLYLAVR